MRKLISIAVFTPLLMTLVAACGNDTDSSSTFSDPSSSSGSVYVECNESYDCGDSTACKTWHCENKLCVADFAPAGTVGTQYETPPCKHVVCDGKGDDVVEVDPTNHPPDEEVWDCRRLACNADGTISEVTDETDFYEHSGDCKKDGCDASGMKIQTPDPTDIPSDAQGDCKKDGCDANGLTNQTPDPTDIPTEVKGDCAQTSCAADGNIMVTPLDDPPPPTTCASYACQNGQAVTIPINEGMACSPDGFTCGSAGKCDTCPPPDAMCSEIGPGAGSSSKATAHSFGLVGYCDGNGSIFCGRLSPGVTTYFRYVADGSGSFCFFDPYIHAKAAEPVKLCEYFNCQSVSCPSGTTEATLDGYPGCCRTDTEPTMELYPSMCTGSEVFMTIENTGGNCVSYRMAFHT